jgi:hypothetical protein
VLIDCDTCTVRGQGCDDCVVTVLLGAPPGWRGSDPTVVPLNRRTAGAVGPVEGRPAGQTGGVTAGGVVGARAGVPATGDPLPPTGHAPPVPGEARGSALPAVDRGDARPVVELDEVERRAVRALAEFGLVPPLRHQDASTPGSRHVS